MHYSIPNPDWIICPWQHCILLFLYAAALGFLSTFYADGSVRRKLHVYAELVALFTSAWWWVREAYRCRWRSLRAADAYRFNRDNTNQHDGGSGSPHVRIHLNMPKIKAQIKSRRVVHVQPPAWQVGEVEEMTARTKNKIAVKCAILAMLSNLDERYGENSATRSFLFFWSLFLYFCFDVYIETQHTPLADKVF